MTATRHPTTGRNGRPGTAAASPAGIAPVDDPSGFTHLSQPSLYAPTGRHVIAYILIPLVLAAIGGQAGFFGSDLFEPRWLARAEVQYKGTAWTETQDVAIQSRSLVGPVANDLAIPIRQFDERLDAGLVAGTQIVRIDYTDVDPALALAVVSEVSDRYVGQAAERTPNSVRETLTDELSQVETDLGEAERRLAASSRGTTESARVEQTSNQALINSLRARKNDLETRLLENELSLIGEESNGLPILVTDPFVFEEQIFPRPKVFAAVGAGAGVLLGLAVVVLIWNRRTWRAARQSNPAGRTRSVSGR